MALHAELHRHLGGAIVPRIFYRYLKRHQLPTEFESYEAFEAWVTEPRESLTEYLKLHTMFERVQTLESLPYFIPKLVRGAYVFEGICYMELRYSPYLRTDPDLPEAARLDQMGEIVAAVGRLSQISEYPVIVKQILCLHSSLPKSVNVATMQLAILMDDFVCGLDLAGPDHLYAERVNEWISIFKAARKQGVRTTGHCFETPAGCVWEILPYLDRIGHGIQIPLHYPQFLPELARRCQCLEVCPTTYLKTGAIRDLCELKVVFDRCRDAGVDVVIGTDNAGLHNVRLPLEFERLLTADVIDFTQMRDIQEASFRHAFAWEHASPHTLITQLVDTPKPRAERSALTV